MQLLLAVVAVASFGLSQTIQAQFFGGGARDPGVRGGPAGAGGALAGLTAAEQEMFAVGLEDFEEAEGVGDGLGPRFNADGCGTCHVSPAVSGTSPEVNPLVGLATASGARNAVPSFITLPGPVREARFKYKPDGTRDGAVHNLFVISGRKDDTGDASDCTAEQEHFEAQIARGNVIFRIPTPVFGAGLIEQISDSAIVANQAADSWTKKAFGIRGHPNRNGNDGTIARFGWKAQNKSLLLFSGEAYNVEMGITNELFQTERDQHPDCQYAPVPNDVTTSVNLVSAIENFANFMRFLAPPTPSPDTPGGSASIARGRKVFTRIGCALCHTPTLRTDTTTVAALANRDVHLFSDLLVHRMGPGLADDIIQGAAGPDAFRTAPLWGLGQRIFFLHDGRTTDLVEAIQAHRSEGNREFGPSEANAVIDQFNRLHERDRQNLLNFLRSL
jgi:CxxC motif-containing protein (DUF1111 family)